MPAPVVIDVGVAEPPRELAVALVDACTQAAAGTECRLLRDVPNGPYTAIAIVTWEEGDRARIEVGLRRDPVSEWRTRELTFQHADVEAERYRSVGFVIGGLATAARDEDAPGSKPAPPPPPVPPPPVPHVEPVIVVEPAPVPTPPPSPSRGWIGLSGMIGGALDEGPARYGGRLGAGIHVIHHLSGIVALGASTRPRDAHGVLAQWLDAGVGLSFAVFPPQGSHLEVRAEVLAEQFSAEAHDSTGATGSRIRTTAAARTGVDAVLRVIGPLSLVAGGEATFRPATIVEVSGESAGATRNAEFEAVIGPRLDW